MEIDSITTMITGNGYDIEITKLNYGKPSYYAKIFNSYYDGYATGDEVLQIGESFNITEEEYNAWLNLLLTDGASELNEDYIELVLERRARQAQLDHYKKYYEYHLEQMSNRYK